MASANEMRPSMVAAEAAAKIVREIPIDAVPTNTQDQIAWVSFVVQRAIEYEVCRLDVRASELTRICDKMAEIIAEQQLTIQRLRAYRKEMDECERDEANK